MKSEINNLAKSITILNQTALDSMVEMEVMNIIKNFTETGISILNADFGFAWWRLHDDDEYELAYKSKTTPYEPTYPRESAGNSIVRNTKKPYFDSDVTRGKYAKVINKNLKSYIIIPVYYNKIIYGSLVLCYKKLHEFTEQEINLATILGTTSAQTITINNLVKSEQDARMASERQGDYFKSLIENSYEVIALINEIGTILYVSQSVKKVFGHDVEYVIGKKITDFLYLDNPSKVTDYLNSILKHPNKTHTIEFHFTNKDRGIKTMESTAVNMLKDKNVGGIVLNVRDITEQKKAETLREIQILLNEEKLKTEFVANATHEFRTPLAIIKGNVDLALRAKPHEIKGAKNELKAINSEVDHLSSLISDLALLTYKMKALQNMLEVKRVNLTKLIASTANRFNIIGAKKNITIKVKKSDNVFVGGDEDSLTKLFANLIKNSISYGKVGGWVSIEIVKKDKNVEVRVKDDGVGISEEDLPFVFDRFYRVDKARTGVEGSTGLGLAIVKWAVLAHGGSIKVNSKIGKGTTFTVCLPILK